MLAFPQIHVGTLTSQADGTRGEASGRQLSQEYGALTEGISALIRGVSGSSRTLPPCQDTGRGWQCAAQKRAL